MLLKFVNSLRSNSTNFLRNTQAFHPAERLLPEMAVRERGTTMGEYELAGYAPSSSFSLTTLTVAAVPKDGSRPPGVRKSALFERSEFADFSKEGLLPRRRT